MAHSERQKNHVKKPFQVIVTKDSALHENFLMDFGFIMSSPFSPLHPSNVVAKKTTLISTHFAQNSTLFGVGGKESLVLLIANIPGPNTFDLHCRRAVLQTDLSPGHTRANFVYLST